MWVPNTGPSFEVSTTYLPMLRRIALTRQNTITQNMKSALTMGLLVDFRQNLAVP